MQYPSENQLTQDMELRGKALFAKFPSMPKLRRQTEIVCPNCAECAESHSEKLCFRCGATYSTEEKKKIIDPEKWTVAINRSTVKRLKRERKKRA